MKSSITPTTPVYTARRYSFSLSNGAEFTLTDDQFSEISEIEEAIKGSAYAVLLPPLKAAYQGGAPLTFGPVQVSADKWPWRRTGRHFAGMQS